MLELSLVGQSCDPWGQPEFTSGLLETVVTFLGGNLGHVPRSSQASLHSLLLPDPPVSACTLCTSRVSVLSGRPRALALGSTIVTTLSQHPRSLLQQGALHTLTLAPVPHQA